MVALELLGLPKTHDAQRCTNGSFARSCGKAPANSTCTWGQRGFPPVGVFGMLGGAVAAVSLVVLMRVVRTG